MRDQTGYYRTTALPTPPSDAGTSERETGITMAPDALEPRFAPWPAAPLAPLGSNGFACCGGVTGHNAWCNGVSWHIPGYNTGSCWGVAQPDWSIVPAAPAAEGPRHGDWLVPAPDDNPLFDEPAAAHPGAEADRDALLMAKKREFEEADQKKLGEWVQANLQHHAGKSWSEGIAAEFAALTSEVRALREDKARLDAIDAQYRSGPDGYLVLAMNGWRIASYRDGYHVAADVFSEPIVDGATLREAIDAARLASPSPTGAP